MPKGRNSVAQRKKSATGVEALYAKAQELIAKYTK